MCGYAVEFLRSCYSCTRAVFGNDPTIVLPGYYYFAPKDAPHYPGVHWYGSKNWMAGEHEWNPPLGERGTQSWRNGAAPPRLPLPQLVGSEACIREGDHWPVPGDLPRTIIDGTDSRCFAVTVTPTANITATLVAIDNAALQAVHARLMQLVYDEQWGQIEAALESLFGVDVTLHTHNAAGFHPARVYVDVAGRGWLVYISGTSNFQQLALQSFAAVLGPQNYGAFSTNAAWLGMSTIVLNEMNALGITTAKPIVFVGHSYGAAVAAVAAAQIQAANPDAPLYLLTYALPKPGNQQLVNLLAGVWHMSIANENDFVVRLAPNELSVLPFVPLLPAFYPPAFEPWRQLPSYLVLDGAGNGRMTTGDFIDAGVLFPFLDAILNSQPLPAIDQHPIAVYTQNLWRRQPTPTWPVSQATWNLLFPTFTVGGGLRFDGTGNNLNGYLVGAGGLMFDGAGE